MFRWLFVLCGLWSHCYARNVTAYTYYLFIGTYTGGVPDKGIYVYRFDSETGQLTWVSNTSRITNPSYLTVSPGGQYIYVCTETKTPHAGSISAFAFDSVQGILAFINKVPSSGENPVYVTTNADSRWVINANYTEGSVAVHGIGAGGSLLPAAQVITYTDSSIRQERQEASHLHAAVFSPAQDFIFLPDLGADKIRIYAFDGNANTPLLSATTSFVCSEPGSGPRHFTFHPDKKHAYCIEELSGTVAAYAYSNGNLSPLQRLASYARHQEECASADIHISPDGLYLYTSNRDDEHSVAIYAIDTTTGMLTLRKRQSALGRHPRNFTIDPTGKFVLVANLSSNNVVVFRRDAHTGLLSKTGITIHVPNPSCLQIRGYRL